MTFSAATALQWELSKLVHELDMRNSAQLRAQIAELRLTTAQASALVELEGPLTLRDLAQRMVCEPSNAVVVVDKLEQQGLVLRSPHPTDRRAKQLSLTTSGRELRERLVEQVEGGTLVTGLSEHEQRTLIALIKQSLTSN